MVVVILEHNKNYGKRCVVSRKERVKGTCCVQVLEGDGVIALHP